MIKFNELSVSEDGKYLTIDVQIKEDEYYLNVYLNLIIVDTDNKYSDFGPVGEVTTINPSIEYTVDDATGEVLETEANKKNIKQVIDIDGIGDRLFFITVTTKGEPLASTPCSLKKSTLVGVTYNARLLYQLGLQYIKDVGDSACDYDKEFIDFILRIKAFELAIKAEKFNWAINYWRKFFMGNLGKSSVKNCSCNA